MRVLLLHAAVPAGAARDVTDVLDQVRAVEPALRALGHEVTILPVTLDLTELDIRLREGFTIVFNLVEELGGTVRLAGLVPALVLARGVPCTGAGPGELWLADDKLRAKQAFCRAAVPTPSFRSEAGVWQPSSPRGQVIVKSRFEHASVGLEADNVLSCATEEGIARWLATRGDRCGEVLVEEYIDGREFNVTLLPIEGVLTALPPVEILFERVAENAPRVVGYRAKWDESSLEYGSTPRRFEFEALDAPLLERVRETALRACRALGVTTYSRVDLRVDAQGRPFVLEVNANPCLSSDAGFAAALARAQIPFQTAVAELLSSALAPR